nr:hypothetical protein [uncultured Sphingomonas sp.]
MIKNGLDPSIEVKRERAEREATELATAEAARNRRAVSDALDTYRRCAIRH